MEQLTLRSFDKHLEQQLRQIALREHISLNKAALKLIRRGAGLDTEVPETNVIGNRLDDL
jgi:hypothetical protein